MAWLSSTCAGSPWASWLSAGSCLDKGLTFAGDNGLLAKTAHRKQEK
jgi:hypothetical protein